METTLTSNKSLLAWLDEKVELTKPSKIVWIDGSKEQIDALKAEAVETGEMIKLNEELLPDCYLHRTAENDVARVEDRTLICSKKEEDAADHQAKKRRLQIAGNVIGCHMAAQVVHRHQGRICSHRQPLGKVHPPQQGADEPGGIGHRNGVNP